MNNEKWKYYNKIVDLLLDLFKDLTGSNSYMRSYDISDRKNRIISVLFLLRSMKILC